MKKTFDCRGKVAVVTGGAGLIGAALVQGLARAGARVVIADTDAVKSRALAARTKACFHAFDITRLESIEGALRAIRRNGRLDVLVNCAYPRTTDWGARLEDVQPGSWNKNVQDHLGGYFFASRAAAEIMKRQGGGSIVNFASIYGLVAPDFKLYEGTPLTMPAAYAVIKGGVIAFSKYLATYYAPHGVRVNVVSPGGVGDGQNPLFLRRYKARTPLGRLATPTDLVGPTVFLASDASSYMTGANVVVDGGWTAW